jgi:HSP20 family molecular chaperone IbpA
VSTITRKSTHGAFEEIFDWLESPLALIRPAGTTMRIEDFVKDGRYVLRAELPGMDPEKDIDVTVSGGVLTIKADRLDESEGTHRSEFRYGAFTRSLPLPATADEAHIQASYENGILEVDVPLKETGDPRRRVPIMINKHIEPT